jgi:UDP-N-acetylglucosamine--N-acetylmuramyl-(pentapeptide) pyrophosphoryl-undecaprenol N-acetylglucosamine transferase
VPAACRQLKERGRLFQITHIAGNHETAMAEVSNAYRDAGIEAEVLGFCDDMAKFYASGDLIIARSGAMTVAEAAICGMPAIFVPLPHAADHHQFHNARSMADRDAAIILEQQGCSATDLARQIETLLFDHTRLAEMSRAARETAVTDARERQLKTLQAYLPPLSEVAT